jgi:hypothetical protein
MDMLRKSILAAPVLLALLAGCGGGGSSATDQSQQSSGGTVIVPVVDTAPFIQLAQTQGAAGCSDLKNRLWLIDGKQVFWDRKGNCADAGWSIKLFGATPDQKLCSSDDSIAGPVTTCASEENRALFTTISQSLDAPNLGLAASHTVQAIPFMQVRALDATQDSGVHDKREVVVKDQDSWAALWAEHGKGRALPAVDFSRQMVVGVFLGQLYSPCDNMHIQGITSDQSKVTVHYVIVPPAAGVVCVATVASMAQVVAIDRTSLPVVFTSETLAPGSN